MKYAIATFLLSYPVLLVLCVFLYSRKPEEKQTGALALATLITPAFISALAAGVVLAIQLLKQ